MPRRGNPLQIQLKGLGRQPIRNPWLREERHLSRQRRSIAFAMIAISARGDHVVPRLRPHFAGRNDVIQGQFFSGKLQGAVLTRVIVSQVNILSGKLDLLPFARPNISFQFHNAGELEALTSAADLMGVKLQDLYFILQPKNDGLLPIDDLYRFKCRIQYQRPTG